MTRIRDSDQGPGSGLGSGTRIRDSDQGPAPQRRTLVGPLVGDLPPPDTHTPHTVGQQYNTCMGNDTSIHLPNACPTWYSLATTLQYNAQIGFTARLKAGVRYRRDMDCNTTMYGKQYS